MILDEHKSRHKYMTTHLRMMIAFQVKLLRAQRDWSQEELAKLCGTKQEAISKLEDWNADFPSMLTLQNVAKAFDCALSIRFEGWEEIIKTIVPDFAEDIQSKPSTDTELKEKTK